MVLKVPLVHGEVPNGFSRKSGTDERARVFPASSFIREDVTPGGAHNLSSQFAQFPIIYMGGQDCLDILFVSSDQRPAPKQPHLKRVCVLSNRVESLGIPRWDCLFKIRREQGSQQAKPQQLVGVRAGHRSASEDLGGRFSSPVSDDNFEDKDA